MNLVIPLPTKDQPFLELSMSLDGQTYLMTFDWNSRTDRWSLALRTENGDAILNGALLCKGVNILGTIPSTLDYVPPGIMFLGGDGDPTLDTIGNVSLFYIEAGTT